MGRRILIVDDEADLVETIKLRLETGGYEVITALDGAEGLAKAKGDKPSLILLDIMMPKLNGYQVCRELKSDAACKDIPVVMLTAKTQQTDKFWGREVGASDYITKPFEFSALLNIIEKYLK